jgi:hemin uptake protein HemP
MIIIIIFIMEKKQSEIILPAATEPCRNLLVTQTTQLRFHSKELLGTAHEIIIEYAGDEYRLRLTRQGKLILTK